MSQKHNEQAHLLNSTLATDRKETDSRNSRQFRLLLWKNWLLQKKKITRSILMILLPILFALFLFVLRGHVVETTPSNETTYRSFVITTNLNDVVLPIEERSLAYAPNSPLVTRIVNRTTFILMGVQISPGLGFASENALDEYVATHKNLFGAIVFVVSSDEVSLPKNIIYKIRLRSDKPESGVIDWKTGAMFSSHAEVGPRQSRGPKAQFGGNVPGYYEEGFLSIQKAVDLSLIAEVNPSFDPTTTNITIQLKRYPFPSYKIDAMTRIVEIVLPLFIMLGFIIMAPTICQEIVLEKENKFKESMKLMGMRSWLYWSSWFVKYLIFMFISVIIVTIILHAKRSNVSPVIGHGASSVTFVFLLLHCVALITFCFAVSTLVSKSSYGSAAGGILYIVSYVPYFHYSSTYGKMTLGDRLAASLDFNLAMGFGCLKISQYETLGFGVQWSNIWSSEDGHTMAHILIMQLADAFIYIIITWYLEAVIPGEFGTMQPLYFPFTKSYWTNTPEGQEMSATEDFMTLVPDDKRQYFESPLRSARPGIQIRGLTKKFGSKIAVNNLNIDIYEDNITVLLGHNGAGKTTAMFMLTGFLSPSKGTAFINGLDIKRDMNKIRQSLGLCPQHDILFDTLTVREHLRFFAILKGCQLNVVNREVTEMIKVLHMEEKTNAQAKTLSGGQKRKLSVGIALISGSKFVILDEPTSGMDPEARRQTWDILQSQRKDRTMILSTHFMDEADLLGDRIAIMSDGEIQCYGTPMFLKNKYGVGYQLTIVKTPTCDLSRLRDVITSQIPKSSVANDGTEEVAFLLPSNQSSEFEALFKKLETERDALGIDSFGVSVTTMEEVFLRVKDPSGVNSGLELSNKAVDATYVKETGLTRHCMQLIAMVYKRAIHSVRNYGITLIQVLIPALFTVLACLTLLQPGPESQYPPLNLNLTHFTDPITPYTVQSSSATNALKLATCYNASISKESKPEDINSQQGSITMDDYLLSIGKNHTDQYNFNYQIGATLEESPTGALTITGYFNNQAYHAIAISLSYLGNALMQCVGNRDYHIETINHPLPRNISTPNSLDRGDGSSFSSCVSFGLAFLFSTFLIFLIRERKSGAKHSQLVSGVRLVNFWLGTFIWDYINYVVPCSLIIGIIQGFHTTGYCHHPGVVLLDLMLYGWAMLFFTYLFSTFCQEASVGFVWLSVINIVTGTFAPVLIVILQLMQTSKKESTVEQIFLVIFPNYCFGRALQNIHTNHKNHEFCNETTNGAPSLADFCASVKRLGQTNPCCQDSCEPQCIEIADNYLSFEEPGIGLTLIFMFLQGVVFALLLAIVESELLGRMWSAVSPSRVSQATLNKMNVEAEGQIIEDSDVAQERQRVQSNPIQELVKTNPVITQNLTKFYGNFVAVNQLSIGISHKECFGLLGVNGAGKSTSFKMLTGEIQPSYGNAYVAGISVQDDLAQVRQKIGYCAQFDSVIDQMTVQETLWMYACAHGIPAQLREVVIDRLIQRLTLRPFTKKLTGTLSGGNKRKVCIAVALMGNPTVVFLDEPTTGVDPEARRHVWNTLAAARNTGATIILTSHSMEECEAICTRLGILVNGRFLCLGSLQHLKDKFSDGYTIIVKLQRSMNTGEPENLQERIEKLKTFMRQTFAESVLRDHHENLLNYKVKARTIKWSEVFGIMERAKVMYEIEDYSVGQTTLEQLFIEFARQQRAPRNVSNKKCCGLC